MLRVQILSSVIIYNAPIFLSKSTQFLIQIILLQMGTKRMCSFSAERLVLVDVHHVRTPSQIRGSFMDAYIWPVALQKRRLLAESLRISMIFYGGFQLNIDIGRQAVRQARARNAFSQSKSEIVNKSCRNITREKYCGEIFHNSRDFDSRHFDFFVRFKEKSVLLTKMTKLSLYFKNKLKFFQCKELHWKKNC